MLPSTRTYEDAQYHNCVFVGRDGSGQPRFASKRGTCDLGGSGFKRDVLGSDKKIGFRLPCGPEIEEVAVFEAPIDLMSFCTLCPEIHSNAVALCGLYSGPLDTYLKDHPHLKSIKLLLDNDEPGIAAAKEMRGRYREAGYEVEIRVPKYGKDWNAQLKYKLTGVLEEVKPPKSKENITKKEETNPMANLLRPYRLYHFRGPGRGQEHEHAGRHDFRHGGIFPAGAAAGRAGH